MKATFADLDEQSLAMVLLNQEDEVALKVVEMLYKFHHLHLTGLQNATK